MHLEGVRASEGQASDARIEQLRAQFEKNLELESKRTNQIKKTPSLYTQEVSMKKTMEVNFTFRTIKTIFPPKATGLGQK